MHTIPGRRRFRLASLGLIAFASLVGTAQATEPAKPDHPVLIVREQADGRLIAVRQQAQGLHTVALRHHGDAVASDCIRLESGSAPIHRKASLLRNHCAHEVVVSYCIEAGSGTSRACEQLGPRDMAMTRIAAGDSLKLASSGTPDQQVNWVACRGDAGAISSLIHDGTRGECLTAHQAPLVAEADGAAR